ncbi:MAG: helix-turn-helix domain-containing protein [Bacteroidota bacterium]
MEAIFIIGATISYFLALLVFTKNERSTADYVLGFWLGLFGLYFSTLYLNTFIDGYPLLFRMGFSMPILLGPVLYLYVLAMVNSDDRFKHVYWLHGLPYLLFNLYIMLILYFPAVKEMGICFNVTYYSVSLFTVSFYLAINPIYVIWALFKLRRHKKKISENFSYTEQIDLVWLNYVVIFYGIWWLVILISHLFTEYPVMAYSNLGYLIYLTLTIFLFLFGYFGLKQQAIYTNATPYKSKTDGADPVIEKKGSYQRSALKQIEAKEYLEKLLDYFENERPYLKGKLNIKEVAESMNVSVNHLSQLINEQLSKNFYDFVNEYRVQEVKSRLANPKHGKLTLLAIAYDSGFNSKSSFNSIFKKHTGFTPSQYLKQKAA